MLHRSAVLPIVTIVGSGALESMKRSLIRTIAMLSFVCLLAACEPEVGSEQWCSMMQDTPRGDWSANEALDYGRHCLFDGRGEE